MVQILHPRSRVGSRDLPDGGSGPRARRVDFGREVRVGCDPGRVVVDGG